MSDESVDHAPKPSSGGASDEERWLDRPGSVNLIIKVLMMGCALSVVADFFYQKHGDYHFQEWIGFDAVLGFLVCVCLVTAAKRMRRLLMRGEDYYD